MRYANTKNPYCYLLLVIAGLEMLLCLRYASVVGPLLNRFSSLPEL